MPDKLITTLRYLAAALISLSGIGHIAALWFRELTELAVLDALLGASYLIIGIGLFGRSRFSLFIGIVVPGTVAIYLFHNLATPPDIIDTFRVATNAIVAACSAGVLWHARNHPSV